MSDLNLSLSMAIQNYMPVLLSAIGSWWIAHMRQAEDRGLGRMGAARAMTTPPPQAGSLQGGRFQF